MPNKRRRSIASHRANKRIFAPCITLLPADIVWKIIFMYETRKIYSLRNPIVNREIIYAFAYLCKHFAFMFKQSLLPRWKEVYRFSQSSKELWQHREYGMKHVYLWNSNVDLTQFTFLKSITFDQSVRFHHEFSLPSSLQSLTITLDPITPLHCFPTSLTRLSLCFPNAMGEIENIHLNLQYCSLLQYCKINRWQFTNLSIHMPKSVKTMVAQNCHRLSWLASDFSSLTSLTWDVDFCLKNSNLFPHVKFLTLLSAACAQYLPKNIDLFSVSFPRLKHLTLQDLASMPFITSPFLKSLTIQGYSLWCDRRVYFGNAPFLHTISVLGEKINTLEFEARLLNLRTIDLQHAKVQFNFLEWNYCLPNLDLFRLTKSCLTMSHVETLRVMPWNMLFRGFGKCKEEENIVLASNLVICSDCNDKEALVKSGTELPEPEKILRNENLPDYIEWWCVSSELSTTQ